MPYTTILYTATKNVATITLNRPDSMNGLTSQMRADITHAVGRAGYEARVLVITGAGRGFCSGQDLGDNSNVADLGMERVLKEEYEPMVKAIYDCPIPTISAVNGPAAGAGANLALTADVVIAAKSAFFMQAFSRIGLIPDAGGTYWLPRKMGIAKAMGAALFADRISAQQADDWGMIWESVEDQDFSATVQARAVHLANGPTESYRLIKQAMRESLDNSLDEQLDVEAKLQGQAGKTRDFLEGAMAFVEKRLPKFEGR